MTPQEAALARRRLRRRIARLLRAGGGLARRTVALGMEGARIVGNDSLARWRRRQSAHRAALARRNRIPLPSLFERYPEARSHMRRETGLRSIPIDEVEGTAVAGPAQRGSDFTPMPAFRSSNWEARWQRINGATNALAILPPIDVVRYGDRYWVEDGHNRVAAALRNGQVEIDAAVTELRPPNAPASTMSAEPLASMLQDGRELRAAGEGRFSAQAAGLLASTAAEADEGPGHDHAAHDVEDDEHGQHAEAAPTAPAEPPRRSLEQLARSQRRRAASAHANRPGPQPAPEPDAARAAPGPDEQGEARPGAATESTQPEP